MNLIIDDSLEQRDLLSQVRICLEIIHGELEKR